MTKLEEERGRRAVQVYLESADWEALKRIADAEERSLTSLARVAIRQYIKARSVKKARRS